MIHGQAAEDWDTWLTSTSLIHWVKVKEITFCSIALPSATRRSTPSQYLMTELQRSCPMQLDILAANASRGRLAGRILLNGSPRRMAEYRKLSCYVMQRDVLLESATASQMSLTDTYPSTTSSSERTTMTFNAGAHRGTHM